MKIGILTHHYINNYGAFLQVYALQKAVAEMLPEAQVAVIDYVNPRHAVENTAGWFRFFPAKDTLTGWFQKIRVPAVFRRARAGHLRMTSRARSADDIRKMGFDAILVGSDEVWNYSDKRSYYPLKYGIGLEDQRLIAYAPSVGQTEAEALPREVCDSVRRFSALSARDDRTEKWLTGLGLDCRRVIDPTFLTEIPRVAPGSHIKTPYILFYYCDRMPEDAWLEIREYAEKNGMHIYAAGESGKMYEDQNVRLTPFEWVGMFEKAAFVVTGTFHGAVFSILNGKPFACYMSNPCRREKVMSLLEEFKLEDRYFETGAELNALLNKAVDYAAVNERIRVRVEESKRYLRESLKECADEDQTL